MNAVSHEVGFKVAVCASVALALTVLSGWSFVESTASAPYAAVDSQSLGEIVIIGSRTVAQN